MISLLGTLIGFGTSIVPEVLGYFKQKQANEQQLNMLEAKAKYASQLSELKLKELTQKQTFKKQRVYMNMIELSTLHLLSTLSGVLCALSLLICSF